MNIPNVYNMESPRTGKPVANQYIITMDNGRYFQSYRSIIAFKPFDHTTLLLDQKYWNWSRTTGKYRNQFLGETKKETEAKIKSGEYKLVDLNN